MRPTQLRAGAFHEWDETLDYSADEGYEIKAQLVLQEGTTKEYTVTSDGYTHTFTILSALLASVAAGTYRQVIWAVKSVEVYPIADEYIELLPNLYSSSSTAAKSYWRQRVEKLQTTLLKLDGQMAEDNSTFGRRWLYRKIADVRSELLIAEQRMNAVENQASQVNQGQIKVVW